MIEGPKIGRRRFFRVLAGAAVLPLGDAAESRAERVPRLSWRGWALGAESRLTFVAADSGCVRRALAVSLDEIARLEAIFSLHRPDSELVRLNRVGRLERPSLDLRLILTEAERVVSASGGAFDPTIQPLWRLRTAPRAVGSDDLREVRAALGWRYVDHGARAVVLGRPGMALTFNGIAQGLISDRIADLLRDMGFERVLVELGETVGVAPGGTPWRVGLPGGQRLALADTAVATSAPMARLAGSPVAFAHLVDPESGGMADAVRAASAWTTRAVLADALSTAAAIAPARAADLVTAFPGTGLRILYHDGSARVLGRPGSAA